MSNHNREIEILPSAVTILQMVNLLCMCMYGETNMLQYIFLDSDTGSNESDIDTLLDKPLWSEIPINIDEDNVEEEILKFQPPYDVDMEILRYRNTTIKADTPRQLFSVCRSDGIEEMKADVLACYKNPRTNLIARLRVRFEDEEGLGAFWDTYFYMRGQHCVA